MSLLREAIRELGWQSFDVFGERFGRRRVPDALHSSTADPTVSASRAEGGYRVAGDCHRELFARLRPPQDLGDVVAKFLLRNGGNGT
jgi:hypothetical protein